MEFFTSMVSLANVLWQLLQHHNSWFSNSPFCFCNPMNMKEYPLQWGHTNSFCILFPLITILSIPFFSGPIVIKILMTLRMIFIGKVMFLKNWGIYTLPGGAMMDLCMSLNYPCIQQINCCILFHYSFSNHAFCYYESAILNGSMPLPHNNKHHTHEDIRYNASNRPWSVFSC